MEAKGGIRAMMAATMLEGIASEDQETEAILSVTSTSESTEPRFARGPVSESQGGGAQIIDVRTPPQRPTHDAPSEPSTVVQQRATVYARPRRRAPARRRRPQARPRSSLGA
jgi:hypothetical protein